MQAAGKPAGGGADGAGAGQAPGSPGGGGEVTEAQLREGEEEGAASIVEVYAALLAGFVAEGDPGLRQARFGCPVVRGYSAWSGALLHKDCPSAFTALPVCGPSCAAICGQSFAGGRLASTCRAQSAIAEES